MRENTRYKFRAWDIQTESMRDVLVLDWVNELIDLSGGIIERRPHEVKIMQYTGLKDKNGVGIYEGDIVKVISGHGWEDVSDVIFGLTDKRYGNYPAFCMPRIETESNSFSEVFDCGDYEIEVIGNIYEDEYLLE